MSKDLIIKVFSFWGEIERRDSNLATIFKQSSIFCRRRPAMTNYVSDLKNPVCCLFISYDVMCL